MTDTTERRAPVQADQGWRLPAHRAAHGTHPHGTISWAEHEEAYVHYARRYGTSQSAEQIAERGGFSHGELLLFLGRDPKTWLPR